MSLFSRRIVLKGILGTAFGLVGGYAFAVEPGFLLRLQPYAFTPPGWTPGLRLRIAVIADLHAGEPYMPLARIEHIVSATNDLKADVIVLLGDYVAGRGPYRVGSGKRLVARLVAPRSPARGPRHSGQRRLVGRRRDLPPALSRANIPILENDAVRLVHNGKGFWLAGLGDQITFLEDGDDERPLADMDATLAALRTNEPAILLAHEPKIFANLTDRFALTLSGTPTAAKSACSAGRRSRPTPAATATPTGMWSRRIAISSCRGASGCRKLPVRLGVPPEIVLVELGADGAGLSGCPPTS